MSKRIETKELKELAIIPPYTISDLEWIAEAQRKASDREWIEMLEGNYRHIAHGRLGRRVLGIHITELEWQAIRQEIENGPHSMGTP